jgi:hypothetical protein
VFLQRNIEKRLVSVFIGRCLSAESEITLFKTLVKCNPRASLSLRPHNVKVIGWSTLLWRFFFCLK